MKLNRSVKCLLFIGAQCAWVECMSCRLWSGIKYLLKIPAFYRVRQLGETSSGLQSGHWWPASEQWPVIGRYWSAERSVLTRSWTMTFHRSVLICELPDWMLSYIFSVHLYWSVISSLPLINPRFTILVYGAVMFGCINWWGRCLGDTTAPGTQWSGPRGGTSPVSHMAARNYIHTNRVLMLMGNCLYVCLWKGSLVYGTYGGDVDVG